MKLAALVLMALASGFALGRAWGYDAGWYDGVDRARLAADTECSVLLARYARHALTNRLECRP